jgi:hypothetical protein
MAARVILPYRTVQVARHVATNVTPLVERPASW